MIDKIIPACTEDSKILDILINSAYRGESSKQGWTTETELLDGNRTDAAAIEEIIKRPDTLLLKYVKDERILGCVELRSEGNKMYLGMLTVQPTLQGKGIGKELMSAAEQEARRQKCSAIFMTVISIRKELVDWYVRHGYQDTGIRKPFAFNDPRFGQPKKHLEFVVLEKQIS